MRPRRKVLFVSHNAEWTGPTNSLLLLLKHLRARCDIAVLLTGQGRFSDLLAAEHIPFFSFPSLSSWSIPAMVRLIRRERFDLVYGNNTSGSSRNAFIAAKLSGVTFICHVRGMGSGWSWRARGFLRFADAVVAVSEACGSSISRFVPRHRIDVVYNGVDFPINDVRGEAIRSRGEGEIGCPPNSSTIISVSHISPRKGQKYAIEAMAEIVKEVANKVTGCNASEPLNAIGVIH